MLNLFNLRNFGVRSIRLDVLGNKYFVLLIVILLFSTSLFGKTVNIQTAKKVASNYLKKKSVVSTYGIIKEKNCGVQKGI